MIMGALTPTTLSKAGTAPNFVQADAATDTIDANLLGGRPAILQVKNTTGSGVTVTPQDNGVTPAGNAPGVNSPTVTVPATTGDREIVIDPNYASPAGVITIGYSSFAAGVTRYLKKL